MNSILKILVLAISFFLAFGTYDLIFGLDGKVKLIEIALISFIGLSLILNFSKIFNVLLKPIFLSILLMWFFLGVSQIFYGDSSYSNSIFNIKLFICIVFLVCYSVFLNNNENYSHYSLLTFSLASIVFSYLVLFIIPSATNVYKGQMIVFDENPNSTSGRLAIAYTYILYFCIQNPLSFKKMRYLLIALCIPLLGIVVSSGSRGSLLLVGLGSIVFFSLSNIKLKYKIISLIGSMTLIPYLYNYLVNDDNLSSRWESAAEGDTAGRTDIWIDAISIFQKNLFFGVGESGYFEEIYKMQNRYIDTHNIFVYIAVCGGALGFSLFVFFLMRILKNAYYSYKMGDVLPLLLFINIIFLASKTGGVLTYLLMWYIFSVVYSYRAIR